MFIIYLAVEICWFFWALVINYFKLESCYTSKMRIKSFEVDQYVANFHSALPKNIRSSLVREEVLENKRLNSSKLTKEDLASLVLEPPADKKMQLKGDASYRILRSKIAEEFNYVTFLKG